MADFKLGLLGSELTLPDRVSDELPTDSDEATTETEMLDGSVDYDVKENVRRTWPLEWDDLIWSEIATLNTIAAYKQELNYINGYMGITGATVVVAYYSGPVLIVNTSGRADPRYRASMTLKEAF